MQLYTVTVFYFLVIYGSVLACLLSALALVFALLLFLKCLAAKDAAREGERLEVSLILKAEMRGKESCGWSGW